MHNFKGKLCIVNKQLLKEKIQKKNENLKICWCDVRCEYFCFNIF